MSVSRPLPYPSDRFGLVYWGLTPQQQPGSYQGCEMMTMTSVFWWRKPEYLEETTDLWQVTDKTFHTYGLCPVRGLNLGRSGVKQSELRRDESGALAHRATAPPSGRSHVSCATCIMTCAPPPPVASWRGGATEPLRCDGWWLTPQYSYLWPPKQTSLMIYVA